MRTFICIYTCLLLLSAPTHAELRDLPSVTILASSSLAVPMQYLIRSYVEDRNISVTASYGSASELAEDISQGTEADLFVTSHPKWMQELKQRGLVDVYSVTNLLKNRLALVVSNNSSISSKISYNQQPKELLQEVIERSVIVIAEPETTPLGIYIQESLSATDPALWDSVISYAIQGRNSQHVSQLILGSDRAGIVFLSDARNIKNLRYLITLDDDTHSPIIYQAAVVAGKHMEQARDFLEYMKSSAAQEIFSRYGFVPFH